LYRSQSDARVVRIKGWQWYRAAPPVPNAGAVFVPPDRGGCAVSRVALCLPAGTGRGAVRHSVHSGGAR